MPRIIAKVIKNPPIIDYKYIFKGWVNWYAKTADTPLLMAIALKQYEPLIRRYINSDLINTALNGIRQFLTTNTNTDHGFIIGGDWRDSMHNYENVELLSNQVLLFTAQKLLGEVEVANTLKDEINLVFWDNKLGYYQDYIGSETFDLLGHALALMTDIVHKENKDSILFALESASSEFGFRNISPPYSQNFCGRKPDSYQNGGV